MIPEHWKMVYIAGAITRREEFRALRTELQTAGITVTSRWLDGTQSYSNDYDAAPIAIGDLADIKKSSAFIAMLDQPSTRGGTLVELGYALAMSNNILTGVVGPCEAMRSPFIALVDISWPTIDAFKDFLKSFQPEVK